MAHKPHGHRHGWHKRHWNARADWHDIQMPGTERFFLDPIVSAGFFGDTDAYIGGSWSMVPWTIDALVGKTFRVGPIGGERYSRATLAPDSKADPRS